MIWKLPTSPLPLPPNHQLCPKDSGTSHAPWTEMANPSLLRLKKKKILNLLPHSQTLRHDVGSKGLYLQPLLLHKQISSFPMREEEFLPIRHYLQLCSFLGNKGAVLGSVGGGKQQCPGALSFKWLKRQNGGIKGVHGRSSARQWEDL